VCVCMRTCPCVHVCSRLSGWVCVGGCLSLCVYVSVYILYVWMCIFEGLYILYGGGLFLCGCVRVYVCVCVCVCVRVCVYLGGLLHSVLWCVCACVDTCAWCVCACVYACAWCVCACVYACACVCVRVREAFACACACACACMCECGWVRGCVGAWVRVSLYVSMCGSVFRTQTCRMSHIHF